MTSVIALAQTTSSINYKENLQKAESFIKKAKLQKAELLVFPEYFMTYYPDHKKSYQEKAQSIDGEFVTTMKQWAKRYQMWIVFGMNEISVDKNKTWNTMIVLDKEGNLAGTYQKTHLFDAYQWKESEDTIPGDRLFEPLKTPVGMLGIGICYDLRFPEIARKAALCGAQVMLYPSAWVKGKGKYTQWKTLLRARAIENEMYVIGCCHYSEDHYMGRSLGFGPSGELLVQGKEKEELLFCEVSLDEIEKVRHANPVFQNRRTELYHL